MPKIFSTFADHAAAQRAMDQLLHAGFAAADVYIDPASQRDLLAAGEHRPRDGDEARDQEGQGVLQSIGHAVASVVGMDTPDAQAQPYLEGRRHGGTVVVVDAVGESEADRARQLLRSAGGMDVHRAGQRPGQWAAAPASAQEEEGARNGEAGPRRTAERALAAGQARPARARNPDAPPIDAGDRPDRAPR